jgi:hypothetical protein
MSIEYKVLVARLLTPMQDCKICAKLEINDPENGKENCRANVLDRLDLILLDAQRKGEKELSNTRKSKYEDLISRIIVLKKKCFECCGAVAILYNMYDGFRGELLEEKKGGAGKVVSISGSL